MRRPLAHWITRDWKLKLVSLGLALGLWLLLVPSEKMSSEKSLTIPLETRNVPAGLEIVERPVPTIDVTVRAPKRLLGEIGPSSLVASLDLDRATVLQQEYALNASMIALPPGAEVVKISPSKVTIKLERTAEAMLEVHATVRGKPAAGFRVARIEIEPAQRRRSGAGKPDQGQRRRGDGPGRHRGPGPIDHLRRRHHSPPAGAPVRLAADERPGQGHHRSGKDGARGAGQKKEVLTP